MNNAKRTWTFACIVSSELFGFWFYFFLIFSFLGRALDEAGHLVSFWAHVNLPYLIVSYDTKHTSARTSNVRYSNTYLIFVHVRIFEYSVAALITITTISSSSCRIKYYLYTLTMPSNDYTVVKRKSHLPVTPYNDSLAGHNLHISRHSCRQ